MFKLDNFGVILFVSFSYKKLLQCSFYEIKKSIKNSNKFMYYNENMNANSNFKRSYLENYNDSEHAVKTKNAPFFMIFPNISFVYMVVTDWTGPLKLTQKLLLGSNLRLTVKKRFLLPNYRSNLMNNLLLMFYFLDLSLTQHCCASPSLIK